MTLRAAREPAGATPCTAACRRAEGLDCHCACEGTGHGADAPAQQLVLLVTGATPAALSPTSPALAPRGPEPTPEPVRRPRTPPRARVSRETHCEGCGRPWGEVALAAMVEAGFLCDDCLGRLWRAS